MDDSTPSSPRIKGAPPATRDAAREARRALALRVNLRRRKLGASSPAAAPSGER